MKTIILARVSTEEQKEAGNSLPSQLYRLRTYCEIKKLIIWKEFTFDESAYKQERQEFQKIMQVLKQSNDKIALCCDKVDRLMRNFTHDLILIEELRRDGKLEMHFPSDNIILHKESPASDLFRFTMGIGLAKYFSDSIGDNVKRSYEQKIRNGEFPRGLPYGYKSYYDNNHNRVVELDNFKSSIIMKIYQWYATGIYSMLLIKQKLKKDYGLEWSIGILDQRLKNTFYYGMMKWKNKLHPHIYPTIISKELYDKVQMIKAGHNKKHFKYAGLPYIYRSMIRCAVCGCMMTPEIKKGKYIYYHCTQYHRKHNAKWVREEELTKQFAGLFKSIQIPKEILEDILGTLKSSHEGKKQHCEETRIGFQAEYDKYQNRIEKMYDDLLDGSITKSLYDKKYNEFRNKQDIIKQQLHNLESSDDKYYISASYLLNLANRAHELFMSSEMEEKRQLLKLILQNLTFDGKRVRYDFIKPFDLVFKYAHRRDWLPRVDSNHQP